VSPVELSAGRGQRGVGEEPNIRPQDSLTL